MRTGLRNYGIGVGQGVRQLGESLDPARRRFFGRAPGHPGEGRDFTAGMLEDQKNRAVLDSPPPIRTGEAMTSTGARIRYRLSAYKPGHPRPELWQTHNVFAENDDDAKVKAETLFQQLLEGLAAARADHSLTHFALYEGNRLVYMSPRRDW